MLSVHSKPEGKILFFGLPLKRNLSFVEKIKKAGIDIRFENSNGQTAEWLKELEPSLILFDPDWPDASHEGWKTTLQKFADTVGVSLLPVSPDLFPASFQDNEDHLIDIPFIKLQLLRSKEQIHLLKFQNQIALSTKKRALPESLQNDPRKLFDQLFFNSSIGTILFDPEGWALRINHRFCDIMELESLEVEPQQYNIYLDQALQSADHMEGIRKVFESQQKGEWDIVYDIGKAAESQGLKVKKKLVKSFRVWAFPISDQEGKLLHVVLQLMDISEMKQKDSNILLHQKILDNLAEGVSLVRSEDGIIVFTNPTFDKVFGYEKGELLGKHVRSLNASGQRSAEEVAEEIMMALRRDNCWNGELQNIKKDGTLFWSMANVTAFDHPDFGHVWVTVQQEITNRILAENALRKAEFENRTILNTFSYLMFRMDREGVIYDFRAPDTSLLLMPPDQFLGKNYRDVLPSELSTKLLLFFEEAFSRMQVVNIEYSLALNGQEVFFEGRAIPISDKEVLMFAHDVTEAKKSKDQIRESEERYNLIIQATKDGIWDWDIEKDIAYVSPRWCELMGVGSEVRLLKSPFQNWLNCIHPDHRGEVEKAISMHFEKNVFFDVDYLYSIGSGKFLWRRTIGQAIFSKEGKPVRMLGSVIDEKKKAELQLQKSIQEVSDYKKALDQAVIVSVSDRIGTITYVNQKFCEQYGYAAEEVIGKNHRILNSGVHPVNFWKQFWSEIIQGKVFKAEVCNKGKNGNLHWSDTTIVPFMDKDGMPYQFLAIRNDITQKRKLERELAEQQLNQQKLITEVALQEQEKERNELGRELHDNINQILATAKIYLGMARSKDGDVGMLLENSFAHLNSAIEEIRRLSHNLVAPTLGDIGLHEAVKTLLKESGKTDSFKIKFIDHISDFSQLGHKGEIMLFRIIQEQLNNIRKHASAKFVEIKFNRDGDEIKLSIVDNGVGFDKAKHFNGIGLANIQNRVAFYNGRMEIVTAPNQGCAINIWIPFPSK